MKIGLINMPFASAHLPSIALSQLRTRLGQVLDDPPQTDVFYLNHDFAAWLDLGVYQRIATSVEAVTSGLGDWFFRDQAFPGMQDNTEEYLRRYFPGRRGEVEALRRHLLHKRQALGSFLEELVGRYELASYDLVGFTSMFNQNTASFAMARHLKERKPELVTFMGGANCEMAMGRVIARHAEMIDFVFSGPGLVTFPELVRSWMEGRQEDCHGIEGVYSRPKLDRQTAPRNEIGRELDISEPVPVHYEAFLESLDRHFSPGDTDPMIMFETSRGCWWGERSHCTFCGLNGLTMKYRGMSSEQALEQFDSLFSRYGERVKRYQAVDNIMPRQYLTEVFPHLESPAGVSIFYEVKADLKDHEMEVLSQAGVTEIQPGIESISTETLRLMGKGVTAFQNLTFLEHCLVYGIRPHWNLLVGFPGEEEEVYRLYVEQARNWVHLPPPSGVFPVRFDRFSPYFREAEKYGLDLQPAQFYRQIYPFPEEDLPDLAYFFTDANVDAEYIARTARWLAPMRREVNAWRNRWSDLESAPRLEIRKRPDGTRVVYDSRYDEPVEHELDELDWEILEQSDRQIKPSRLSGKIEGADDAAVERRMEELHRKHLLFEERGLYKSLVLDRKPAFAGPEVAVTEMATGPERAGSRLSV